MTNLPVCQWYILSVQFDWYRRVMCVIFYMVVLFNLTAFWHQSNVFHPDWWTGESWLVAAASTRNRWVWIWPNTHINYESKEILVHFQLLKFLVCHTVTGMGKPKCLLCWLIPVLIFTTFCHETEYVGFLCSCLTVQKADVFCASSPIYVPVDQSTCSPTVCTG
jgi:hypothetical protein